MIKEDYVSFETAKLLKEKGFDDCATSFLENGNMFPTCIVRRKEHYPAPTLQMACKWLRNEKGISIDIITDWEWIRDAMTMTKIEIEYPEVSEFTGYYYEIHQLEPHRLLYDSAVVSKNYEEVCEAAIKYCLENLI